MRMRGLEPPRGLPHTDLNRARLPIPPHPRGRASLAAVVRRSQFAHESRAQSSVSTMSTLKRVVLLSIVALVSVPALAGAQSQAPDAARGRLVEVDRSRSMRRPLARGGQRADAERASRATSKSGLAPTVPEADRAAALLDRPRRSRGPASRRASSTASQSVDGVTKRLSERQLPRAALDRRPSFIGAPALWGPTLSSAGQGVKIGIIDDGVDPTHPYFKRARLPDAARLPEGQTGASRREGDRRARLRARGRRSGSTRAARSTR